MSFTCDKCGVELTAGELVGGVPSMALSGPRFVGAIEILHLELCGVCFDELVEWVQTRTRKVS